MAASDVRSVLDEVGMVEDPLQHRRHHEGRRHSVLLHKAQPLSCVEPGLHHVGVACVQVAEHADDAADVEERDAHHAHGRWHVGPERRCDAFDSGAQLTLGDADGLRQSRRSAGEQDHRVPLVAVLGWWWPLRRAFGDEVGGQPYRGHPRAGETVDVVGACDPDRGPHAVRKQPLQLVWCQGGIHQCRGSADPRGTEHRRDRRQAAYVDDGDTRAGHSAVGQASGTAFDGRRQLAVADFAPVDDERGAAGVVGRSGVDECSDVHARLRTVVTTRRSAAAGWSTDRAVQARRASMCPESGTRTEFRSGAA